ncbi:MAG TPA: ubiquitin-like small modifier protein 1 [Vicinamibacteria bacterium]
MTITVRLPGPLLPLAEGRGEVPLSFEGATVDDALRALWERFPGLRHRVLDDQGRLRRHVNVFVDRRSVKQGAGLATGLADGAVLSVIPAVSGG